MDHVQTCPHPPQEQTPAQDADPDDGFDSAVEELLRVRKFNEKLGDWTALYVLLFGEHEPVPDPGEEIFSSFPPSRDAIAYWQQSLNRSGNITTSLTRTSPSGRFSTRQRMAFS
jgi:hypothetical protein